MYRNAVCKQIWFNKDDYVTFKMEKYHVISTQPIRFTFTQMKNIII